MEYLGLVCAILLPLAIPIGVALFLCSGRFGRSDHKTFSLRSDEGLWRQPAFWLSIAIPIGYFLSFGVIAWQGHVVDLSSDGLIKFINISALPLGLLSTSIPLSVIVASFHSTEQTAKQIVITQQKNNIESFYTHRNEMFNYFDRVGELNYYDRFTAKNSVHPRMHKIFFNGTPERGVPTVNEEAFKEIESLINSSRKFIHIVLTTDDMELLVSAYVLNACMTLHLLILSLNLMEINEMVELRGQPVHLETQGERGLKRYLTIGDCTDDMVATHRYARAFFRNLCDFAGRKYEDINHPIYGYFETGGQYRNIKYPMNVEHFHAVLLPNINFELLKRG
ncbi:hypothetical protein EVS84_10110 [Pseudomonas koreensis]|uniref:Uncharacterized protein n=2 Tax=Pseudomonas TaxID=286 RepID=A0A4Q4L698_9PSED|nr:MULTISPECIES: hypothetical protein [Pseudomonas]MDM8193505.1 hypothetical protein [Pseudomonas fluorescens]MDP8574750.1 hypothetical protein [Pseudomonas iranensis]RYM42784.1 hypothetical protein EVS84_10110 [Pseudomonas koreensis]